MGDAIDAFLVRETPSHESAPRYHRLEDTGCFWTKLIDQSHTEILHVELFVVSQGLNDLHSSELTEGVARKTPGLAIVPDVDLHDLVSRPFPEHPLSSVCHLH